MKTTLVIILLGFFGLANAQVILKADGETDTYELINATLAPGYTVIEAPDCAHDEFGKHITQIFDNELNCYVFQFHIHTDKDNDRCKKFDRQRNEIKAYEQSPANTKAIKGETVVYKWKFKLDKNFKASKGFTHLHQLKAVGGIEDNMPLVTLTARKGDIDKLELRYAENLTQETLTKADLNDFKGNWVEATETVTFGETGKYKIEIIRIKDEKILMSYQSEKIRAWKTDADFIRPKWGIYRSLKYKDDLHDEVISFTDFSIEEK